MFLYLVVLLVYISVSKYDPLIFDVLLNFLLWSKIFHDLGVILGFVTEIFFLYEFHLIPQNVYQMHTFYSAVLDMIFHIQNIYKIYRKENTLYNSMVLTYGVLRSFKCVKKNWFLN